MSIIDLRPMRTSKFPWVGLFTPEERNLLERIRARSSELAQTEQANTNSGFTGAETTQHQEGEVFD